MKILNRVFYPLSVIAVCAGVGGQPAFAKTIDDSSSKQSAAEQQKRVATSPALKIERDPRLQTKEKHKIGVRSFDGSDNNLVQNQMNQAHSPLARWQAPDYSDLTSTLAGEHRVSARIISNELHAQTQSVLNPKRASDFLWQWGQFIDHDLDLTDGVEPAEPANVAVPIGDPWFDPSGSGNQVISMNRSIYDTQTGDTPVTPRAQINEITGWIDGSGVYGSDEERAAALRANDGTGMLRTSAGNLLPFNSAGLANAGGSAATLFLAGDVRVNEQVGLTVMHTLFVREHNRLAKEIAGQQDGFSGDEIYQAARRLVGAQIQAITYREFLPVLLGPRALPDYSGYDSSIDAGISNLFSAAAFRLGHSMLNERLLRLDAQGNTIPEGDLPLRDAFFAPQRIVDEGGIEPVLRGLSVQVSQRIDVMIIDDVRNFLFGQPGAGGFDLAALNIQRGRDHGLPDYNSVRVGLGLAPKTTFAEITESVELQNRLAAVYDSVDDMDVWAAGLAEDPLPGSLLGELFHSIVAKQFAAVRDGDRYWYESALTAEERRLVNGTSLADIIRRNSNISDEIGRNVFVVDAAGGGERDTLVDQINTRTRRKPAR